MVMPHCAAGNPVVWVNTRTHVYYMNRSAYYGKTTHGRYVCRNTATAMGAHRAGMAGTSSMTRGTIAHGAKHEGPLMSPRPMMSPMRNGSMGSGTAPAASSPGPVPAPAGSGAPTPGPSLSP